MAAGWSRGILNWTPLFTQQTGEQEAQDGFGLAASPVTHTAELAAGWQDQTAEADLLRETPISPIQRQRSAIIRSSFAAA